MPKIKYVFAVDVNKGELAKVEATSLKQAWKKFAIRYPDDVGKVSAITSDQNGYEWIK